MLNSLKTRFADRSVVFQRQSKRVEARMTGGAGRIAAVLRQPGDGRARGAQLRVERASQLLQFVPACQRGGVDDAIVSRGEHAIRRRFASWLDDRAGG